MIGHAGNMDDEKGRWEVAARWGGWCEIKGDSGHCSTLISCCCGCCIAGPGTHVCSIVRSNGLAYTAIVPAVWSDQVCGIILTI